MSNQDIPIAKTVPTYVPASSVIEEPYIIRRTNNPIEEIQIEITDKMVKSYSISRTVKILCLIDMLFSFIYGLSNPWFLLPFLLAFTGFYGAKTFNINYTYVYLVYIILEITIKISLYLYVYFTLTNDEKSAHLFNFILIIISFFISIWIIDIIYKFIKSLKNLTSEQILYLRNRGINNRRAVVVYY